MVRFQIYIYIGFLATMCFVACTKYLDKSPDKRLAVPSNIQDLHALLNYTYIMNENVGPILGDLCSDDFSCTYAQWQSMQPNYRNSYIYAKDIFDGPSPSEWNTLYSMVYYSNVVLDGLNKITDTGTPAEFNLVKGSALFYRSYAFYNLEEIFGQPYDSVSSESDLGIPLKLTPDLTAKITRSSVKSTYDQIINDLKQATGLFPDNFQLNAPSSPTKPAVFALLARVSLSKGDYYNAAKYADSCLRMYRSLVNYNSLNPLSNRPFSSSKQEVLFQCSEISTYLSYIGVDSSLYNKYDTTDLRKYIFFRTTSDGHLAFKGSYDRAASFPSNGLTTDEVYLIRAESYARIERLSDAISDINALLINRYKTGTYVPFESTDRDIVVAKVIDERRKELAFRGIRWSDLRRLNKDPKFAITIRHTLNGQTYELAPKDLRYAISIPPDEISLSGIQQNPR